MRKSWREMIWNDNPERDLQLTKFPLWKEKEISDIFSMDWLMTLKTGVTIRVQKGKSQKIKWVEPKYFFTGIFLRLIHSEEARYPSG